MKCRSCAKEFADERRLAQHEAAVHGNAPARAPSPVLKIARGRGRLLWLLLGFIVIVGLAVLMGKA